VGSAGLHRNVSAVSAAAPATLTVNETFFSIQGEGTRAGLPCVFVRLTGCPLRCSWCDTAYAFHEGDRRSIDDVVTEIARHPCRRVLVTGGEPLAQPAAFPLIARLLDDGWEVLVETSGHVSIEALDRRAVTILDVKAPGSGETHRMEWSNLDRLAAGDEVKFVLADRADYEWSRALVRERGLAKRCVVLFSPVHGVLDPGTLGRWILDDGLDVRVQVQLHKYLWPDATRGV
jgi:7-carboxy-7-deazaguanine synthase